MSNRPNLMPQAPSLRILIGLAAGILGLLLCMVCGLAVVPGLTTPTPTLQAAAPTGTTTLTVTATTTATPSDTPTGTLQPSPTPSITPTIPQPPNCPQATPELLAVDPVTSPTDQLSQVIIVRIGNGESVRITTESGVYAASGSFSTSSPAQIRINLIPNAINHLDVSAQVRRIQQGPCTYGGYTLSTNRDRNGRPLEIQQRPPSTITPTRTRTATPTATKPSISLAGAHPSGIALDPDHGLIWVAGRDSNSAYGIDEDTLRVVVRRPVGSQPFGVAYYRSAVFVANFGSDSLSYFEADPAGSSQVNTIVLSKFGGEPTFPLIDPARGRAGRLFVPLHQGGALAAVDLATRSVTNWTTLSTNPTPQPGGGPYGLGSTLPGMTRLLVGRRDRSDIVVVDTVEPVVSSIVRLDAIPYYIAANPNPIVGFAGNIYRIYVTLAPSSRPDQPDRMTVFQANESPSGGVFNNPTFSRGSTVNIGPTNDAGGFIAIYPHVGSQWDDTVWVSANKQVQVWDAALTRQLKTFTAADGVGNNPYGIAIDPKLKRAFVTDGDGDKVVVLTIP